MNNATLIKSILDLASQLSALPNPATQEEWERRWCRYVCDYGFEEAYEPDDVEYYDWRDITSEMIAARMPRVIKPDAILYSNQDSIRLDTLAHYLKNSELFNKEPWFNTPYPVVVPWKQGYMVLDGTHRLLRDRLFDRESQVIIYP